ncbi:MAG TPA: N-acetyl-gamma-glutamyl-phosphate reductase [Pseudomonadales bacterium]
MGALKRVFIDGQAGTTGLEIAARLRSRRDIDLLEIDDAVRKDPIRRKSYLNEADIVLLCLPDVAAREAVALLDNTTTRVIDASSTHRVTPGWTYGLPELNPAQRDAIRGANRLSVPGCYPTGFILSVRPLIDAGVLSPSQPLSMHAVSGYSGGGRSMIDRYRAAEARGIAGVLAPVTYGLTLTHKHVPEMQCYSGTRVRPLFVPSVGHYYKGMIDHVPLANVWLNGASPERIHAILRDRYANEPCVNVLPLGAEAALDDGFLSPLAANDTNRVDLMVFGNDTHTLLVTRYDNLGKGASGAAVQCLNLMLGIDELHGLTV